MLREYLLKSDPHINLILGHYKEQKSESKKARWILSYKSVQKFLYVWVLFNAMHALKWNLKQKQRFKFLQNSCVNFVLGIRLARWSSGSRFLETLRAAAPVLIVIYPPCPSPVSTLPTLVWAPSSLFGDENKRWTPLPCTECGMNRGVGDNVWMFQCSSNTPPTPPPHLCLQ